MLDIKFIRENPDKVKESQRNRHKDESVVDELLLLDKERRQLQQQIEVLKARKNKASSDISARINRDELIEEMRKVSEEENRLSKKLATTSAQSDKLLGSIPNIPSSDTPVGKDETANVVLRKWGEPTKFDFKPRDHVEIGKQLDLIDTDLSSAVSGSRFCYLKNEAVLLEFALIQLGLQTLMSRAKLEEAAQMTGEDFDLTPFTPILPPDMIKTKVYRRIGRLTDDNADDKYSLPEDDLWLAGSAEHTLLPLHMDQFLNEIEYPKRYVGFSTAFRREAGTYGKDVNGILRRHQFDKLEMLSFTVSEKSDQEQRLMIAVQEYLMQKLGIPYQVIILCTGDMGFTNTRHIDIEAWMPGQNMYRETQTSDHNSDYQTRGLNLKVKRKDNSKDFVHSNDATVFAIGRMLIAILENNQMPDGSVKIPEVLTPYVGKDKIAPKV